MTNFKLIQTEKEFAAYISEFDENGREISKRVENTVEKTRNCLLRAISSIPTCFQKTCIAARHIKTRACL